ncbi:MAG: arsenate reductase (glutaredoxin) [Saprospiraceae bacterium]|nr:arsenate reductase (glutaredoxin) [Saprospiraceae bacterium]
MIIYHNPRCGKSRETLKLIESQGIHPEIILYLVNPPDKKTLADIIEKLGIKPEGLVRKTEDLYLSDYQGKTLSDDGWLTILSENPRLIERPIVISGMKAVIGRPPEKVKDLF